MGTVITAMSFFGVRSYILPQSKVMNLGCFVALSGALFVPVQSKLTSYITSTANLSEDYLSKIDENEL